MVNNLPFLSTHQHIKAGLDIRQFHFHTDFPCSSCVSMTSYSDKGPKPTNGKFLYFDHVTFYVGNAKQAASYYVTRLGFQPLAYKGLETGSRKYAHHVVHQNRIIFQFVSPYESDDKEVNQHVSKHGDGVKDVAFAVENLDAIVAVSLFQFPRYSASSIRAPSHFSWPNY
ncbi:unnamed protein product [Acanthoscelides obtectus]|uniref:4-hydroxyphenylpyruvate dioxygenase n=1 Tax=Acanthoscelides obtectus TaxID=200917 RepID=A0A9P0LDN7_ACAOB|nr:unnamed protein product [Acanthoscelides obtectus]CAK1620714.1 4-hydroxyphenylpyruvate dioxygenase [Acanthoscelides obtectus]